eukprot:6746643-Pyramimonas_sp.AAC.1
MSGLLIDASSVDNDFRNRDDFNKCEDEVKKLWAINFAVMKKTSVLKEAMDFISTYRDILMESLDKWDFKGKLSFIYDA